METDVRFADATTLTVERTLPGPIERVWAYLTEPDKRARWLGGGVLGSPTFSTSTLSAASVGSPMRVYCPSL